MVDYWMGIYYLVISGVLGAAIGSFLNVVAYRLPLGMSLNHPGSRCPSCKTPLGLTENIPVVGWIWLQGRCKHCGIKISPRYPLVEAATALLFMAVTWLFGPTPATLGCWVLISFLMALSLIDFDTQTLPYELTLPGIYLGLMWQMGILFPQTPWVGLLEGLLGYGGAVLFLDSIAWLGKIYLAWREGVSNWPRILGWEPLAAGGLLLGGWAIGGHWWGNSVAGSLAIYGVVLLLWDSFLIIKSMKTSVDPSVDPAGTAHDDDALVALGGGDVLLGGLLGAWLGWQGLIVALAVGFLAGAVFGISGRLWGVRFALGPFLALGGIISLLTGTWLIDSYLLLLGIT